MAVSTTEPGRPGRLDLRLHLVGQHPDHLLARRARRGAARLRRVGQGRAAVAVRPESGPRGLSRGSAPRGSARHGVNAVPRPGFVIGVDFGGTKVAVASATLLGTIVKHVRFDTEAAHGAEQAVHRAGEACRAIISETEADTHGPCLAAGIVCPGIVLRNRIALAPNVPGWEDLRLQEAMQEELELAAIAVENDVKAAGLAEARWGSLSGCDPAVFLSLGTGVAASVLVGGQVLAGAHGAAGELGYSLCGSAQGRAFAAGRAPLEEFAGGRFIGIRATRMLKRNMTAADAFAATDEAVSELVDGALDELAVHVANMAIILDPQRIAVGGGLMGSAGRVLAALGRQLKSAVPFPPSLVRASFLHDAALRGAIALALDLPAARSEGMAELATGHRRG
ncbi:MAG: ROK family protein [Solirubrobacterales bacterium]|nr:ROK family protein [Solirubrobacterales bacterium]